MIYMKWVEKINKQMLSKKSILFAIRDTIGGLLIGLITIISALIFGNWADLIDARIKYSDPQIAFSLIQQYSNICLTLFGFSLIGSIFTRKTKYKISNKKKDNLELTNRALMLISLLFLFGFIMFNLLYLIVYPDVNKKYLDAIPWIFNFGIGSFAFGIALLFIALIFFFVKRYTGLIERWRNFWKWVKNKID